jgi:hypothetical protein
MVAETFVSESSLLSLDHRSRQKVGRRVCSRIGYADKSVLCSHKASTDHGLHSFAIRGSRREGFTCLSSAVVPLVCLVLIIGE